MQEKKQYTREALAKAIDQTILKADAARDDVDRVIEEARQYGFASVCVNSAWIGHVAKKLAGSGVTPCCVVGFPLGATDTLVKAEEARRAVELGAGEVDMVVNIGAVKSGDWDLVRDDIAAVVKSAGVTVKVILETCLLTEEEKILVCRTAMAAGAAFVKTSTGFGAGGATIADVALMRKTVGPAMGVKASGGVRSYEDAVAMLDAGASRLGTSGGPAIVQGARAEK
jgi:deoxyribose-phosphate aldolase